ncbi:uncharacterized protein LOC144224914 [Crocuta crocuta]
MEDSSILKQERTENEQPWDSYPGAGTGSLTTGGKTRARHRRVKKISFRKAISARERLTTRSLANWKHSRSMYSLQEQVQRYFNRNCVFLIIRDLARHNIEARDMEV